MNKVVCNYAVVRFLPYPETQEFANVGVVLACASQSYFDFRLELHRRDRITHFFPELDEAIFTKGRTYFRDELESVRNAISADKAQQSSFSFKNEEFKRIFLELVKSRESIFRFSPVQTLLTEDPIAALDHLFDHYVERLFAQKAEYQEKIMAKRLSVSLRKSKITGYRNAKIGNDLYEVTFPLMRKNVDNEHDFRAIKPLDLDKQQTTQITEHGDAWISRVIHLSEMSYDPSRVLFAVSMPSADPRKVKVAETVIDQLRKRGSKVVPYEDTKNISEFAKKA